MRKIILIFLVLSIVFIVGCVEDNGIVGSVVNTKEVKEAKLANCLDSCVDMPSDEINDCKDICYVEIADSFNDKVLCNNIIDKHLRTNCLIY